MGPNRSAREPSSAKLRTYETPDDELMNLWHHPINAIWHLGRDAQHASLARCMFALVALGLLLSGSSVPCRLFAAQMQSEELPDSQSPVEETSEVVALATAHEGRASKDHLRSNTGLERNLAALRLARRHSAGPRASVRSRCGELLAQNGCGATLRC